jgi:diadenosine tetraphosphate (Ap4A) HIT family hydrolase
MHALFSSLSRNEVGHVHVHISAKLPNDKIKNYQDIGSAEYQKTQKAVESCGNARKLSSTIQHYRYH